MDLKTIKDNSSVGEWMPIFLPDGTKTDIEILILGRNSFEYKSAVRKLQQKAIEDNIDTSCKEWDEVFYSTVIGVCIKDWKNVVVDGKAIECNSVNKAMIIKEYPFIVEQLDLSIHKSDFFIKVSQNN